MRGQRGHLTSIYRKLGVSTRKALSDVLADRPSAWTETAGGLGPNPGGVRQGVATVRGARAGRMLLR